MTKKDYEAIASTLKLHVKGTVYFMNEQHDKSARETSIRIAKDMASMLAASNPKFDTKRFLSACGVEG